MPAPRVMLSCGEASGDLYAGALTAEIRRLSPGAEVFGLGGRRLAAAGGHLTADLAGLAATGLTEALSVLPHTWRTYRRLVRAARTERPDVFVAIDFPEVNFRLGAAVAALGVPVVYYIGPQAWAWRGGRFRTMRRFVTRALVIFPFEEPLYREAQIPVAFVGHPLLDLTPPAADREAFRRRQGLDPQAPVLALLPGSRPNEVRRILPDLTAAARLVRDRIPAVQCVVARAPGLPDPLFEPLAALGGAGAEGGDGHRAGRELFEPLEALGDGRTAPQLAETSTSAGASRARRLGGGAPPRLVESQTDAVLAAADVVLTASGTATVQTAIHERPMVVVYRLSPLTWWLARRFIKVKAFGMVNLVAGRTVVPEYAQAAFKPAVVAADAVRFLTDEEHAARTRRALREVRTKLGGPGASRRAAEHVLEVAGMR